MPVPHGSRWTSSQPSFHCAPTFRTTPWTVWHASPGMCSPAWESRKASWVSWMILDDWWEVGPPNFFGEPKNIRVPTPYTWNILKSFSQMIHWTSLNYRLGWWLCGLGPKVFGVFQAAKQVAPPPRLQPTHWARNAPIMDPWTPGTALIPLLLGCKAGFISKWWSILWDPPKTQHQVRNLMTRNCWWNYSNIDWFIHSSILLYSVTIPLSSITCQ